jgi:glucans biosynthesis protein C
VGRHDARLHAIDAVRASALLLGIVLHGTLSFSSGADDRLWPVHDVDQSKAASVAFFLIHIFRMPLFFFVAGLFCRVLMRNRGERGFWRDRLRRIAIPLIGGWVVCSLALVAVVAHVLSKRNGGVLPETLPADIGNAGLSFLHLWFLYILLWLYAGVSIAKRLWNVPRGNQRPATNMFEPISWLMKSSVGAPLLAVPVCVLLVAQPEWRWWLGVPTPAYSFIPAMVPLGIYGYCFALGWVAEGDRSVLTKLADHWERNFTIGLLCAIACLAVVGTDMSFDAADEGFMKIMYATAYSTALVAWMLGALGLGMRFFERESTIVRYLADASYWMYIAHLPIVMAMQALVMDMRLPWLLKFAFVIVATILILLWSYRYLVRTTWIGALLNGPRPKTMGA